jgi:hypothetical protein
VTEEQLLQKHERMGLDCYIAAATFAGLGLAGAVTSGVASSKAGGQVASAANNAATLQQQQYQQTLQNQQPYMQAGQTALGTIQSDQASGTGFAAPFNPQTYIDTPGYQFQQQQGANAINSSAAATGGTLNGGTLKALDQYTTGLANSTYGQAYNQYLATSQQQYGQLFNVAQLGENATATTGQQGAAAANASGNYMTQAGNASAAGTLGVGNAVNSGLSNLGTVAYGGYLSQQGTSGYSTPPSPEGAQNYGVDE